MQNAPRVLMIGWELPPHNSGGLGIACAGLGQALAQDGLQVNFTLPYSLDSDLKCFNIIDCHDPHWEQQCRSRHRPPFNAYAPASKKSPRRRSRHLPRPYSQMEQQVEDYAARVFAFARQNLDLFDVVHAHDWMSLPAAMRIKRELGKPYIAHIHSTEFDRSLSEDRDTYISSHEIAGMQYADRVIAVSYYTKRLLVEKYQINPDKIDVVHNGVVTLLQDLNQVPRRFAQNRPVVVFMGRLTVQKGPDYFLELAQQVLAKRPDALFIVAGMGDMYRQLLFTNAGKSLSANVLFSGFVRGGAQKAILQRADVFVMPSVSEPFGLVATEAALLQTPVIASKNSGVVEVMAGTPQFDFWDTRAMAAEILHLLDDPTYRQAIVKAQIGSLHHSTWKKAARKVEQIYRQVAKKTKSKSKSRQK